MGEIASDLLAIAHDARDSNIRAFVRWLKDRLEQWPRGESEVRVSVESGDDSLWIGGGFIVDFLEESPLSPDRWLNGSTGGRPVGRRVRFGDMVVHVDNLAWDHVALTLPREPPDLGAWFRKWFWRDRPFPFDGLVLRGSIHRAAIARRSAIGGFAIDPVISVDFGTAGADALVELVEICRRAGIPTLVIGATRVSWEER